MPIFPDSLISPPRGILSANSIGQPLGVRAAGFQGAAAAAAWPAANRALYLPVMVETQMVATQMFIYVGAAAGNVDVGIYAFDKRRLVSMGSTAVAGTNTLQLLNIADTTLTPGNYWLGMVCSTVTTLTVFRLSANTFVTYTIQGVQQEALGATTLPATATFASPASAYLPVLGCLVDLAA